MTDIQKKQGEPVALPERLPTHRINSNGWNACLNEIAKMGPLFTSPVPAAQQEPVGEVVAFGKGLHEIAWAQGKLPRLGALLYTHADTGEAERLDMLLRASRTSLDNCALQIENLQAQLAERDALLRDTKLCIERNDYPVFELLRRIDAALSVSAVQKAKTPN